VDALNRASLRTDRLSRPGLEDELEKPVYYRLSWITARCPQLPCGHYHVTFAVSYGHALMTTGENESAQVSYTIENGVIPHSSLSETIW
jgi:hypothetical protein